MTDNERDERWTAWGQLEWRYDVQMSQTHGYLKDPSFSAQSIELWLLESHWLQAMMIAAEQIRLLDAKELSMTYAYSAPETEEIQVGLGFLPYR